MPTTSPLALEALRLTEVAAQLALQIRPNMQVTRKPDGSLVTTADKEVEAWLLPRLVDLTPGAGFWGEEGSFKEATDFGFWTLDPIDGTSNFAFGQPLWGVTAGLVRNGQIEVGITIMPEVGTSLVAVINEGVQVNGKPLPQIPKGPVNPWELVGHGSSKQISKYEKFGKARHLGAFVVEATYVAEQKIRAMTSSQCKLYDAAAGILAVRELDGEVCGVDGTPFNEAEWMRDVRMPALFIGPKSSGFPYGA